MTEGRYPILARKHRRKTEAQKSLEFQQTVSSAQHERSLSAELSSLGLPGFTTVTNYNNSSNSAAKHTQMTYMVESVWHNTQTSFSMQLTVFCGGVVSSVTTASISPNVTGLLQPQAEEDVSLRVGTHTVMMMTINLRCGKSNTRTPLKLFK